MTDLKSLFQPEAEQQTGFSFGIKENPVVNASLDKFFFIYDYEETFCRPTEIIPLSIEEKRHQTLEYKKNSNCRKRK